MGALRTRENRVRLAIAMCFLCGSLTTSLAQSAALSDEHLWVANLADEAAIQAESVWYKCISDVPERREAERWVDEVVKVCGRSLTLALDVRTAATWIRFKHGLPEMVLRDERLKQHKRLVDQ